MDPEHLPIAKHRNSQTELINWNNSVQEFMRSLRDTAWNFPNESRMEMSVIRISTCSLGTVEDTWLVLHPDHGP
jgi:hypothetical protein